LVDVEPPIGFADGLIRTVSEPFLTSEPFAMTLVRHPAILGLFVASAALGLASSASAVDGVLRAWGTDASGETTSPVDLGTVTRVDGGAAFTIVLLPDGTVECFGSNAQLQCDVPANVVDVIWVAAGAQHSLAILTDGTARGWGDNASGQITFPVDLGIVQALAGGASHSLGLTAAGTVRCWGLNDDGQCDVPVGLGVSKAIAAGDFHSMAVRTNDTVAAWGRNTDGQATVPGDLGTVLAIAAGASHSIAVNTAGEVRCWGSNADGQCAVPGGLVDVISVAAGGNFSMALERDGTVTAWGLDTDGETTVPADLEPATFIGAGDTFAFGIEADPTDCDANGIPDEIEIRDDADLDCTGDGLLDSCIDEFVEVNSANVAPFGSASTVTATVTDSPTPLLPVEITITVKADLGSSLEFLVLSLNDTDIDYLFNVGGSDCPTEAQTATLLLPADDYVALLDENRDAVFELRASAFVSTAECSASSARMSVRFRTDVADCNENDIPDLCEIEAGDVADDDGDGIPDSCQVITRGDHNRDAKADLVFFDPATRRINFSYLNGTTVSSTVQVQTAVSSGWAPVAQGDIDGDGQLDFIVRNATNGRTFGWLMDGTAVASFAEIGYALPSRNKLLAMADIDGDGDDDIVWIDEGDRKVYGWRLAGTVLVGGGLLGNSSGTVFVGAGDVDDDGDDDFVFRNTTTGRSFVWVMQAGALSAYTQISGGASLNSDWEGRGLADANGDGTADIFWRNKVTGAVFCWYLDGTTQSGGGQVGYNPGTSSDLVALADIDGDGTTDLIWRNGNSVFGWLLDGIAFDSGALLRAVPANSTVLKP
jgi:hypothetical protein